MIASSPIAKVASLVLSIGVLVGGMLVAVPDVHIEIAGGGEAVSASMGTTFEDMVEGTLSAERVENTAITPAPPDVLERVAAVQVTAPDVVNDSSPATVPQTLSVADTVKPLAAIERVPSVLPSPSPSVAPVPSTEASKPVEKVIFAQDPETVAPPQSARPKPRDPTIAAKAAAARPKPKVAQPKRAAEKAKVKKGNGARSNTQGVTNGTNRKATAKAKGTTKKAAPQSGNKAASNYPGKVMGRIARVRKPRVNSRGTAVISFSISANGGLGRVSVARSSGSAALDNAAIAVVRKAAPFPVPPAGAQRRFSIRIKGR